MKMKMKLKYQIQLWESILQHPMFVLILICLFAAGCTYYNVKRIDDIQKDKEKLVTELMKPDKYLILHTYKNAYYIRLVEFNIEDESMMVKVFPLPSNRGNYKISSTESTSKQQPGLAPAHHEIHFYSNLSIATVGEHLKLPFSNIYRVEVYEKNVGKSAASAIFTGLGITAGALVIIAAIVIATKSSCPFVYTKDSTGYIFSGEIYPGAIYKALERDDFLKLSALSATDDQFQIKLSNELMERQYTDLCRLIEVHHSADVEVYLDKAGNVHTISEIQNPASARTGEGEDVISHINCRDDDYYYFNETSGTAGKNELYLNFSRPQNALNAKLILHGKNTYWLDYTFGKFYSNFGTYYEKHASLQDAGEAETNIQWAIDQGIRLGVWIKKQKRWQLVDHLEVAGPLANRTMLVPIDLTGVSGPNVEIKLTSGFMFWEFDQIGIDYSKNQEVSIHYLEAFKAIDQDGSDVKNALIKTDGQYLEQPGPGLETNISFRPAVNTENKQSSIFLHSRGYYEYIRDYTHFPDIIALTKFKKAGAFSEFSRDNYLQFQAKKSPQNSPSL